MTAYKLHMYPKTKLKGKIIGKQEWTQFYANVEQSFRQLLWENFVEI